MFASLIKKQMVLLCLFSCLVSSNTLAQDTEQQIHDAIHKQMIMYENNNKIVYHKFCREDPLCLPSIKAYASYVVSLSESYNIDPWLLLAIILHESNFNAFTVGKKKERGLTQLHPYSYLGKQSRFVQEHAHWSACKGSTGHCQYEVVEITARMLHSLLGAFTAQQMACFYRGCEYRKKVEQILSEYNTGKRFPVYKRYVNNILGKRKLLMNSIGLHE